METRQSHKKFANIKSIVTQIEKLFPIDPSYCDWKGRGEINIRCPKCRDRKYHLGLNFSKNVFNCYRCPYKGKLDLFLKEHKIKFYADRRISSVTPASTTALKIKFPKDKEKDKNVCEKAKKYLASRGFDIWFVLKNFQLSPVTDRQNRYFGYLIFKINDYSYYARKFLRLSKDHKKHIIRKSDPKMKLYYSFEKNNSNVLLVVESLLNLIKASQFGYDSVCIFGKSKWSSFVEYSKNNKIDQSICIAFDIDVNMDHIESFIRKIVKETRIPIDNIYYLDPKLMKYKDIAKINDKKHLEELVNNKKKASEIFIENINI